MPSTSSFNNLLLSLPSPPSSLHFNMVSHNCFENLHQISDSHFPKTDFSVNSLLDLLAVLSIVNHQSLDEYLFLGYTDSIESISVDLYVLVPKLISLKPTSPFMIDFLRKGRKGNTSSSSQTSQ